MCTFNKKYMSLICELEFRRSELSRLAAPSFPVPPLRAFPSPQLRAFPSPQLRAFPLSIRMENQSLFGPPYRVFTSHKSPSSTRPAGFSSGLSLWLEGAPTVSRRLELLPQIVKEQGNNSVLLVCARIDMKRMPIGSFGKTTLS
ncbi:hypothetical protein LINPERPRIM_LOCUS21939 [Linum perenne]